MNVNVFFWTIAFTTLLFVQPVQADVESLFRERALSVIGGISPECKIKVEWIDFAQLERAVKTAPIRKNRISVGGRTGALWKSGTIHVDPAHYAALDPSVQEVISLHEFFGASLNSYFDDGYAFSTFLMLCSKPQYRALAHELVWPREYMRKRFITLGKGGGATVVGGGGDGRDVSLKTEAIGLLLELRKRGHSELFNVPIASIFRGLIFMNIYRSPQAPKGHFNLYIPHGPDGDLQAVIFVQTDTYETLAKTEAMSRNLLILELGALFAQKVLGEQ